jgi:hypothetical protein
MKSTANVYADNLQMRSIEDWRADHDADAPQEELGWFELWVEANWGWLKLMTTSQVSAWNEYTRGRPIKKTRGGGRTSYPWEQPTPVFYQDGVPVKVSDTNYDEYRGQQ